MAGLIALYERAIEEFGRRVREVAGDQWHLPTPDEEWTVRDLVAHLVYEERWAPLLIGGATLEEVGDRFDGDLLGDDPKAAWESAARDAVAAAQAEGVLTRTVHVSFGQISGEEYLAQLTSDHTVHAWDLAHAIGADEQLDPKLIELAIAAISPEIDRWRAAGIFGPAVEVPPEASRQAQLLGLTGRSP